MMYLTPFDAEDPAFRLVFEEVLKRRNWPAARKGEGYRSPMTQMAWEVSFSVVNLLNLHRCVELPTKGERDGDLPPPPKYPLDL